MAPASWLLCSNRPPRQLCGCWRGGRLLQLLVQQQYRDVDGILVWRSAAALPSAAERLVSPYQREARTRAKRDLFWDGYKLHLTETLTREAPQLITPVETTV